APRAPSHLAPELAFSLPGDLNPLVSRLFAEAVDSSSPSRGPAVLGGAAGELDVWQRHDDEDFLTIASHLRRPGEPARRQLAGEPARNVFGHRLQDYVEGPPLRQVGDDTALGRDLLRLGPDKLELVQDHFRAEALLARGVRPGGRAQPSFRIDGPAFVERSEER